MKKPTPKRLTTAQALTREIRRLEHLWAPRLRQSPVREGPARFLQCWTAQRGSYAVLHALDEDGQVWELHSVFDTATKQVTEQFWTPLGMERRKP